MELPGWNSIETTGALSSIFFWLSIISLLLLGATEVISHRYGERRDWLIEQQQQATRDHSESEIARLHRETAALTANAEQSRAAIADANARTAEATLELARYKAPRSLNAAQLERITKKMKRFAGLPFDFLIQTETEPIALMEQIGEALKAAGLVWEPWSNGVRGTPVFTQPQLPQAGIVAFTGLTVQIDDSKTPVWGAAVFALVEALKAEGLAVEGRRIVDGTVGANAIHIYIGGKPQ